MAVALPVPTLAEPSEVLVASPAVEEMRAAADAVFGHRSRRDRSTGCARAVGDRRRRGADSRQSCGTGGCAVGPDDVATGAARSAVRADGVGRGAGLVERLTDGARSPVQTHARVARAPVAAIAAGAHAPDPAVGDADLAGTARGC